VTTELDQAALSPENEAGAGEGIGLELRGLAKSFHGVTVVEDVNMTIKVGEFVTLLGPSGSGKTTCLNMVAGFILPDKGQVLIKGQDLAQVPPENRGLGIVFQSYALFPHMSVADNVAFPLKRRKIKGQEHKDRVRKALEGVELTPRADARPSELSGGQQQRAAWARALVFEPSLILFDEPIGALDRRLRERLQVQLREMHDRLQFTSLYVTHDQEEALNLSDRIAIMNEARIAQIGACEDIYKRPQSAFVAQFLGDANLLKVTLLESQGASCTVRVDDSQVVTKATRSEQLDVGPGGQALMVARPESLHVTQEGGAGDALLIRGTMIKRVFVGQDVVSTVETPQGSRVTVRERPEGVVSQLPFGGQVEVMWRTLESAIVVPTGAGLKTD
jgi:ABC-type Fe3+/spermidine/putrescine transport system ATPase subunit